MAIQLTREKVVNVYKKFKKFVYYDKSNQFIRDRLATFEAKPGFSERLNLVASVLDSAEPSGDANFIEWLSQINFRIVPKKLEPYLSTCEQDGGCYVTNRQEQDQYNVTDVNYYIDCPIELHLLDVFWITQEGWLLDKELGKECYGSRLDWRVRRSMDKSTALFVKYHEQYAKWRDSGIKIAKQVLEDNNCNVYILGLDIEKFYYNIEVDYREIASRVTANAIKFERNLSHYSIQSKLLKCIEAMHDKYRSIVGEFLNESHPGKTSKSYVPIGLNSSAVIANWYLSQFDKNLLEKLRPAYYGRYVDDILIVMPEHTDVESSDDFVDLFLRNTLEKNELISKSDGYYSISCRPSLKIQPSKCLLQYFDKNYSTAGLDKFKKKLDENASNFLLLPVDEADVSLEDVAFDLLYDGSSNKLSSVRGLASNRYELAKHLARQTILHLYTKDTITERIALSVLSLFMGRNAIEFFDLWERIYTFLYISGGEKHVPQFNYRLSRVIDRVGHRSEMIKTRLKIDLDIHKTLSEYMALGLVLYPDYKIDSYSAEKILELRASNLIRHHFVRTPLINYTEYDKSYAEFTPTIHHTIDPLKVTFSPRYVHFDECYDFASLATNLSEAFDVLNRANDIYSQFYGFKSSGITIKQAEV